MTTTIIPPAHLERIYHLLAATYGEPAWIPDYDPLGGLVGTILSQHTSDINSERSYQQLVATFPGWEQQQEAGQSKSLSAYLYDELTRRSPEDAWHYLRGLPGVGPKTAACVLLFNLGLPVMPIDTHVYRTSQRLGLIGPKVSIEQAHDIFARITPPEWVYPLHVNLIRHGRQVCHARRPDCLHCPLFIECKYAGSEIK